MLRLSRFFPTLGAGIIFHLVVCLPVARATDSCRFSNGRACRVETADSWTCNDSLKTPAKSTVELRPVAEGDLTYLRRLFSDERVFPTFYWPGFKITDKTMQALLETDFETIAKNPGTRDWGFFAWVVSDSHTGEPVGYVELNRLAKKDAEKYLGSPQKRGLIWTVLGVAIDPARQGRGYATSALRLAMQFGFNTLGVHGNLLSTAYNNDAMGAVAQKAGAVRLREDVPLYDDTERGDNVYGLFAPGIPRTDDRYFPRHVKFPLVGQKTDVTCGPAVVRSTLLGLDIADISEENLVAAMHTGDSGTTPEALVHGLEARGAVVRVHENAQLSDIDAALENKHGVTVLITDSEGIPHWVLVTGSNATEIREMDPWEARSSDIPVYTRSEFLASWHAEEPLWKGITKTNYLHFMIEVAKPVAAQSLPE